MNCEVKENDAPASQEKLKTAFKVYLAHQKGVPVLGEDDASGALAER